MHRLLRSGHKALACQIESATVSHAASSGRDIWYQLIFLTPPNKVQRPPPDALQPQRMDQRIFAPMRHPNLLRAGLGAGFQQLIPIRVIGNH